jgi:hypothetical protein
MPEKISNVEVLVSTYDDNKEDSQFEVVIYQGVEQILHTYEGARENWDNGNQQDFQYPLNVDVVPNGVISVVCALQDGDWGRNNTWTCYVDVIVQTDQNRQLVFRRFCAFDTNSRRRRHELPFGRQRWSNAMLISPR